MHSALRSVNCSKAKGASYLKDFNTYVVVQTLGTLSLLIPLRFFGLTLSFTNSLMYFGA